jgi:hypothetical protein
MRQSFFRPVGVAMVRASTSDPGGLGALPWPSGQGSDDAAALRAFIGETWAADGLASAV